MLENHPAAHLHKLLREAYSYSNNQKVYNVWANVLECNNETALHEQLYNLQTTLKDVEFALNTLNNDRERAAYSPIFNTLHTRIFLSIMNAKSHDWGSAGFKSHEVDKALDKLESLTFRLSDYHSEEPIKTEELDSLKKKLDSLEKMVSNSNIDAELKTVILDQIEFIRRAIYEYKMRGVKALKESVEHSYFLMLENQSLFEDNASKDENLFNSLKGILKKIITSVSNVSKMLKPSIQTKIEAHLQLEAKVSAGNSSSIPLAEEAEEV